ncbi:MAG: rhamnogalacturonan lyase [Lachnospiraceae bacterium]
MQTLSNLKTLSLEEKVLLSWDPVPGADRYQVFFADACHPGMQYRKIGETAAPACGNAAGASVTFEAPLTTHVPYWFTVKALRCGEVTAEGGPVRSEIKKKFHPYYEKLGRGLAAARTEGGIYLSWRMLREEVKGFCETGLTGTDYAVCRNGKRIALVTDSTNYLDPEGTMDDSYTVIPVCADGTEGKECAPVRAFRSGKNYIDLPLHRPADGVTPDGKPFTYRANDMSVGDADGDGEYEYYLKWDPSNSRDVSQKGYTGRCIIDCYKLSGRLLWRLDLGPNIRAGAHYTQFIVMDFNLDGKAEMAVKTAPGTKMIRYAEDGSVLSEAYVTLPESDRAAGVTDSDNYVCSAEDYRRHLTEVFMGWQDHPEVKNGHWPDTLEECFGIPVKYSYPLSRQDAEALTDYFLDVYAPSRSPRNELRSFEGFVYSGPEYLTMFAGDGTELETIPWKFGRVDDGLMWGDYAMPRIEPCNRVDRFLAGAAYLDGERPYLIESRGYYTRATIAVYDFFGNHFHEVFSVDSGFPVLHNPFRDHPHIMDGPDPVYGMFAGQGNHSLSTADVDFDGRQEIVYGAAVIDHDGSLLYSSYGNLPDGRRAKLGHGDSFHVAKIDPDRTGLQIFNVFEGAKEAPYGYALRDAATGKTFFGVYAEEDLGRCMIGKICPGVRGWQVWADDKVYDCRGNLLDVKAPGTNQGIRWAGDLTTQVTDFPDYLEAKDRQRGVVNDLIHGIMLDPEDTLTNNWTKGNPCLVADVFGDYRENLLLRRTDSSAIRIYLSTELTHHKMFTWMQDLQYRSSVAWQNDCYNQTGYPSFYYGTDMDWSEVLPELM